MSEIIKVAKGECLLHEHEESTKMYFLQSGSMAVFKQIFADNI